HSLGDVLRGFDVVALHVDHADGDVLQLGDLGDDLDLGKLATGHFQVDFVDVQIQERGEHRGVSPRADRPGFVIAEAEVRGKTAFARDRGDRAVEDVDELFRVLAVRVAAHRGLVDANLAAAGFRQRFQFG